MANWKELGEVPDSEDEDGLDSQDVEEAELQPAIAATTTTITATTTTTAAKNGHDIDIWDFPDSEEDMPGLPTLREEKEVEEARPQRPTLGTKSPPPTAPRLPASSPPLPAPSDDAINHLDLVPHDSNPRDATEAHDASISKKAGREPSFADEVSTSFVRITAPITTQFTGGDDVAQVSTPPRVQNQKVAVLDRQPGRDAEAQEARHVVVRYERSLRPRKPIQEHPYLLENAQYSNLFKEHGVRPVRMAINTEQSQREELSQDNEFEQESQESMLPEVSNEQQDDLASLLGGDDEFNFPSSSPRKISPLKNRVTTSSLPSSQNTNGTSVLDEDLPDLDQLLNPLTRPSITKLAKRKTLPSQSSTQKRRRRDVVHCDPPESNVAVGLRLNSPELWVSPIIKLRRNLHLTPRTGIGQQAGSLESPPEQLTPLPKASAPVIDISSGGEDDDQRRESPPVDQDTAGTASDSESDQELVTQIGRRIKGVLPASWLRLDQQSGRDKVQKNVNKRQRSRTPERELRRGVAQPRQTAPRSATTRLLFEESDDETPSAFQKTTDDIFHNQTRLPFEPLLDIELPGNMFSDDGGSVIEEDHIDRMLSGRKRQRRLSETFHGDEKQTKVSNNLNKQRPRKLSKQPKITGHLQGPKGPTSVNRPKARKRNHQTETGRKPNKTQGKRGRGSKAPPPPPPRLSILDIIIKADAPRFLRIAARTAEKRVTQGRSSPRHKSIKLATRQDHADAMSVLNEWRSGSIKQRPSVSAASQAKQRHHRQTQPLAESSGNSLMTTKLPSAPKRTCRKLVKHVSKGGSVSYHQPGDLSTESAHSAQTRQAPSTGSLRRAHSSSLRPAQLEMNETEQTTAIGFHSKKTTLDHLFWRRDQGVSASSSVAGVEMDFDIQSRASPPVDEPSIRLHNVSKQREEQPQTSRFRKKARPRRIDTKAQEYTHADDPLPIQDISSSKTDQLQSDGKKLQGLGSFGTIYTRHFEIFPLDSSVYFHESTLIGSGVIKACLSDNLHNEVLGSRPRVCFNLGDQVLTWGPWNDQVSSEVGIVLDFIAEQLEGDRGESCRWNLSTAVAAATFVFRYVRDSLSLAEGTTAAPFVARLRGVLEGFSDRMSHQANQLSDGQHAKCGLVLSLHDRLLLVSFLALRICQGESSLMGELSQMEELLKSMARLTMSTLLNLGTSRIKKTYDDLNKPSYRERGLGDDAPIIHSWALLMKILEHAHIPRASFWDMLQTAIGLPQTLSSVDARQFERIWETIFTLLPLVEFDDSGKVIPDNRHYTTSDGWVIPQKLLKRVFQLYQENERQAPSFNNYCRALVGRCHHLVQQWGWRKSAPVVGVIFDFFGSQSLAHLRNEEVYKSPRFLEDLAKQPSLDVEADDRCFHVFLKLLALSIRKLRDSGADKDIRNLVARTIPNHNRQYFKEQNVHERDLAALRNHHDLIGTLFWACPPNLRPAVTLIERLVMPANSHKEACLINIRAWNQLARFVVASGEATTSFKPFNHWRNSFFQQMMQQFDSVAADIQQQLLALSKDVSKSVSRDMVDAMISMNRAAVVDVLHIAVMASLDVMRHAPNLEAATFCLNTSQMQQVFKNFAVDSPGLNWAVLRATLATLDSFLVKVDEFKANEDSQQSESQILNSAQADDALLVVDHDLSRNYFLMARCILSSQGTNLSVTAKMDRNCCIERVLMTSARMGMRFINGGLMGWPDMFKPGKYGLFDGLPHTLDPVQRRQFVLFLLTLLKNGLDEFSDVDFSLCEVWTLSLVKPQEYLKYENEFAKELGRHGKKFVPHKTGVDLNTLPDYNGNRELFEFAMADMRRSIHDAEGRKMIPEYTKTLKRVMEQIQRDLKEVSGHASQHRDYVIFVRDIISLIRAYGSEICTVDDFFYQVGKDYSPSQQDPQLQAAVMLSYGLRLQEGDGRVIHQLFFFLFNNFKFALTNGKLQDDVDMLRKGMKNQGIVSFVLGKMMPAIIRASFTSSSAFPLMDVYVEALRLSLAGKAVARELSEGDLPHVAVTLQAIVEGMSKMCRSNEPLSGSQRHVMRQVVAIMNLIWPSLYALSVWPSQSPGWSEVRTSLEHVMAFAVTARTYLGGLTKKGGSSVEASLFLDGLRQCRVQPAQFDSHVSGFTRNIVDDIAKNWVIAANRITIQTPGKAKGVLAKEQGVEEPAWDAEDLVDDLYGRIQEWCWWWERFSGVPRRVEQPHDDVLF